MNPPPTPLIIDSELAKAIHKAIDDQFYFIRRNHTADELLSDAQSWITGWVLTKVNNYDVNPPIKNFSYEVIRPAVGKILLDRWHAHRLLRAKK